MLRSLSALLLALVMVPAVSAQGLVERFQSGVHYLPIDPAQPSSTSQGVEVIEVFSYACIHCAHFQAAVDQWKKTKPASATFVYLPAAWNPSWEMVARAFYAAESMGILDKTHKAFFDALHVERKPFTNLDSIAQWYATTAGVKAEDFVAAATSSAVNIKINRSKQMVPRYRVEGTPSVVVAGKYVVTGETAGGYENVFEVVNFLVAKEAAARGTSG
jgi:thiol:disulfide interchange protein DsbA